MNRRGLAWLAAGVAAAAAFAVGATASGCGRPAPVSVTAPPVPDPIPAPSPSPSPAPPPVPQGPAPEPTPDTCPTLTSWYSTIHNITDRFDRTADQPYVGGHVVIDSTPLFAGRSC